MTLLKDIVHIKAGHPFRGAIKEDPAGNGFVVQVKSLSNTGVVDWDNLIQTTIEGRHEPNWLMAGDVIFISRGPRLVAAAVPPLDKKVVCSPHLFVMKIKDNKVVPEFLAWQINQEPAQQYFKKHAMGTIQTSISRDNFQALPIAVPSLKSQRRLLALVNCVQQEEALYQKLIDNRRQQLAGVAQQIFNKE